MGSPSSGPASLEMKNLSNISINFLGNKTLTAFLPVLCQSHLPHLMSVCSKMLKMDLVPKSLRLPLFSLTQSLKLGSCLKWMYFELQVVLGFKPEITQSCPEENQQTVCQDNRYTQRGTQYKQYTHTHTALTPENKKCVWALPVTHKPNHLQNILNDVFLFIKKMTKVIYDG